MSGLQDVVEEWHDAFRLPVSREPGIPSLRRVKLRERLVREEAREVLSVLQEIRKAFDEPEYREEEYVTELAGELADLLVVAYGTAAEFGIPLDEVFLEKMQSNMTKLEPCSACGGSGKRFNDDEAAMGYDTPPCLVCDGRGDRPLYREDGKVLKGSKFREADVRRVIYG